MSIVRLHFYGFIAGFIMDLIVGDPHWFKAHPVRLIGALYAALDKFFLGEKDGRGHKAEGIGQLDLREYVQGLFTTALTALLSVLAGAVILYACFRVNRYLFIAAEAFLTCTCLSTASLIRETSPVKNALVKKDIESARKSLSYVVGRDTAELSEKEIIKAVIETLAENLSDGIISPLFYLAVFGPCGGLFFKAVSTGDSMIGYKNKRYFSFGRAAAKTDDFLNYLPARLSAMLIVLSAIFIRKMSAGGALLSYKNEHKKTESPNAGCPESAMAGALGAELGGAAFYGGKLIDRPLLGTDRGEIKTDDISAAQQAVVLSSVFMEILCAFVLYLF